MRVARDGAAGNGSGAPVVELGRATTDAATPFPVLHGEGPGVGLSAALIPTFREQRGGERPTPSPYPRERGGEIPRAEISANGSARRGIGKRVAPGLAASLLAHAAILGFSLTALNRAIEPPPEPISIEVEIGAPPRPEPAAPVARDAPPPAEAPPPIAEAPAPPLPPAAAPPPPPAEVSPPVAEAPPPPPPEPAAPAVKDAPAPIPQPKPPTVAPAASKPSRIPPSAARPAKSAERAEPRAPSPRTPAPVRAHSAAADAPPPAAGAAAAYRDAVYARLAARTRYPEAAMETRPRGVAMVRFSLDASGQVTSAALARSAGDETLDADAVSTVRRAGPFPPPPPGAPRDFTAPLNYRPR